MEEKPEKLNYAEWDETGFEIPEEYHVAAVAVGFNTDGAVTWDDNFRIE